MAKHNVLFAVLIVFSCQIAASAAEKQWHAGVAKVNISPELPIWMSGYASRNKPATSKHDDLWAKALVIEDADGHRAVLITLDLVGIPRELSITVCEQIEQQFKVPRSAIALCSSHTHSGPVIRGNLMAMYSLDEDQGRRINEYKADLVKKLERVVGDAIKTIKPAKLSWGVGEADFAINRRNNPEGKVKELIKDKKLVGPFDHDVPILAVYSNEGQLRAVVGGYACHATVLSTYTISGDWPGAAQYELERRHPGVIAMFVAGCGGDQNPLPRRTIALMYRYGGEFANGVDGALDSDLQPIAPSLKTAYKEFDLPFGKLPTRAELELMAEKDSSEGRWAKYMLAKWDKDGSLMSKYPYPIQVWKLGNKFTWVFLGGEVVVDYALRIKADLGAKTTWVASYANDVMAYIPSRRMLGEGGYEGGLARYPYGLPAVWDVTVEETILDEVRKLATEVAK